MWGGNGVGGLQEDGVGGVDDAVGGGLRWHPHVGGFFVEFLGPRRSSLR